MLISEIPRPSITNAASGSLQIQIYPFFLSLEFVSSTILAVRESEFYASRRLQHSIFNARLIRAPKLRWFRLKFLQQRCL
ncbi:hypothetical protein M413DRAFT_351709 [Hebeloma cylindrosporum]|uniref:Uncharacterized protein n=1 Tax=Hebeloma cylindrosporum TaxID=76867 RepID=A0A0C2YTM8_HEBCY|nr:hypothetical protein M413DRAFT_351709 [Hebeloma cylindrosporum h7]